MTQDETDQLARQNAESWKRQADSAGAALAELKRANDLFTADMMNDLSARGRLYVELYKFHFHERKTTLTTTTTDNTLIDIVKDAVLLTDQAVAALEAKAVLQ